MQNNNTETNNAENYIDSNIALTLENLIFNTVVRLFNNENVPITLASVIMRSAAGRIDNMAIQALIEDNMKLHNAMAEKNKNKNKKETENE